MEATEVWITIITEFFPAAIRVEAYFFPIVSVLYSIVKQVTPFTVLFVHV